MNMTQEMKAFIGLRKENNMFSIIFFWEYKRYNIYLIIQCNKSYIHNDHNKGNKKSGPNKTVKKNLA